MLPTTGSTMTAATSPGCAANSSRTAPASLKRAVSVSRAVAGGDAGAVGRAERRGAGAGLHQKAVAVAVIAALELHDARAGPVAARASRSAAIVASVPELTSRTISIDGTSRDDRFGHLDFERRRRAERQSRRELPLDGGHRPPDARWPSMHRAPGADVVDELVAVFVPDARALGARDEARRAADGAIGAHRRVDAAGQHLLGALEQRAARRGSRCRSRRWCTRHRASR